MYRYECLQQLNRALAIEIFNVKKRVKILKVCVPTADRCATAFLSATILCLSGRVCKNRENER
jgi:hypothetical protein